MRRILFLAICALIALGIQLTGCSEKLEAPVSPVIIHDSIPYPVVHDSLIYLPGDSIFDTTYITRDSIRIDTVIIDSTVYQYDTLIVELPNPIWKDCSHWELTSEKPVTMITLHNPAGTFMIGMERIRLTTELPDDVDLIFDFGSGQVFQKSVYGNKHFVDWSSPVTLPENALVTILLTKGTFTGGSAASVMCPKDYFEGFWVYGVKAPTTN